MILHSIWLSTVFPFRNPEFRPSIELFNSASDQLNGFLSASDLSLDLRGSLIDLKSMLLTPSWFPEYLVAFQNMIVHRLIFHDILMYAVSKFPKNIKEFVPSTQYLIDEMPEGEGRCRMVRFVLEYQPKMFNFVSPKELGFGCIANVPSYPGHGFWQPEMHPTVALPTLNLAFLLLSVENPTDHPHFIKDLRTILGNRMEVIYLEILLWAKYKHPEWRRLVMKEFKELVTDLNADEDAKIGHWMALLRDLVPLLDSEVPSELPEYLKNLEDERLKQKMEFCLDLDIEHLESWSEEEQTSLYAELFYEWAALEAKKYRGSGASPFQRLLPKLLPFYLTELTSVIPVINYPEFMYDAISSPAGREVVKKISPKDISWGTLFTVKRLPIVAALAKVLGESQCLEVITEKFDQTTVRTFKLIMGHYPSLETLIEGVEEDQRKKLTLTWNHLLSIDTSLICRDGQKMPLSSSANELGTELARIWANQQESAKPNQGPIIKAIQSN